MKFYIKKFINLFNAIVIIAMALFSLFSCKNSSIENKYLIIYNNTNNRRIAEFPIDNDGIFSISFVHSVNKSPITDYYRFNETNDIFVYKTIYYNYGAGVETELENDEVLSYGDDGSMIIDNINKMIYPLTYYLSSVGDHKLRINDGKEISLWETCGKNIIIRIEID